LSFLLRIMRGLGTGDAFLPTCACRFTPNSEPRLCRTGTRILEGTVRVSSRGLALVFHNYRHKFVRQESSRRRPMSSALRIYVSAPSIASI
jgi:hypothetical protein